MAAGNAKPFGGKIDRTVAGSKPWWPQASQPPQGAPNILVVLFDDVASTGRTLVTAARGLLHGGAASVDVAVTHGLFVDDAVAQIHAAGVRHVWSTDCVPHGSNAISVVPLLADALRAG